HRNHVREPARSRRLEGGDPAGHEAPLRRDARQPGTGRARHFLGRRDCARSEAAAPGGCHLHHALPAEALRPRRRPRLSLGHEVPRRARRRDRWSAGGRRHVRLGSLGKISGADRALRGLPRHGFPGGVHRGGVPPARPARRPAGLRRLHEPGHRLSDPPRNRDAALAHEQARGEHAQGDRFPRQAGRRRIDCLSRAAFASGPRTREAPPSARLRRGIRLQPEGRPGRRPALYRGAESFFAPRQRRRCEVAGDPPGEHHALSHERRGARRSGNRTGHDSPVDRPRRPAGPDRGSRAGLESCKGLKMELRVANNAAYVYTGGKTLDAKLPAVVFIHGGENDHCVWALQSRYLAHHGYAVLAVDLPGHGKSGGAPLATIEDMAGWIVALLDAATVNTAALVGHSMGSLAALECAARYPQRVRRLALLGTAFPMRVSPELLEATKSRESDAHGMINAWSHSAYAHYPSNPGPGFWVIGGNLRLMQRQKPGVLYADFAACDGYKTGFERAAQVKCPALFLLGARDAMTPARAGRDLARAVPNSTVV